MLPKFWAALSDIGLAQLRCQASNSKRERHSRRIPLSIREGGIMGWYEDEMISLSGVDGYFERIANCFTL